MNYKLKLLIGSVIGGILGYAYYYFYGCTNGCPLTSNGFIMTIYGGVFGIVITWPNKKNIDSNKNADI